MASEKASPGSPGSPGGRVRPARPVSSASPASHARTASAVAANAAATTATAISAVRALADSGTEERQLSGGGDTGRSTGSSIGTTTATTTLSHAPPTYSPQQSQPGPQGGIKASEKPRVKGKALLSSKSFSNLSFAQRRKAQQEQQHQGGETSGKPEEEQKKKKKIKTVIVVTPTTSTTTAAKTAKTAATMSNRQSTAIVDGDFRTMRDIDRPPPGDPALRASAKNQASIDVQKRRSSYFDEAFAVPKKDGAPTRWDGGSALALQDRVRGEAIVMAEVKTNVILNDEFTFITELSYHLSLRFQRPVSSIVVTIQHGVCMMFGGTFEPSYSMAVYALPSSVQATTNKRNAALIQKHMEESLGVPPSRGILRFVPMPEDSVAFNGKTTSGEIYELAKEHGLEIEDPADDVANKRMSRIKNRLSMRQSLGNFKNPSIAEITPPASASDTAPPMPALPPVPPLDPHGQNGQSQRPRSSPAPRDGDEKKTKRRKSFVASILGWPSAYKEDEVPQMPSHE